MNFTNQWVYNVTSHWPWGDVDVKLKRLQKAHDIEEMINIDCEIVIVKLCEF